MTDVAHLTTKPHEIDPLGALMSPATEEAMARAAPANPMLTLIERVMLSPDLPIERMTALMDMQERQMNKEAEQLFNGAFAEAMAEMPSAPKSGFNGHTKQKYSTLDDLVSTSRPVLSRYGLALNWKTDIQDGWMRVSAILRHKAGWREENSKSAPLEAGKGSGASMNVIQAHGSTETYLKRYTGFGILGLSSEDFDDDGRGASKPKATVTADQFIVLRDLIEATQTDEARFHQAYSSPADLHQFPARFFNRARSQLERKKAKLEATQ